MQLLWTRDDGMIQFVATTIAELLDSALFLPVDNDEGRSEPVYRLDIETFSLENPRRMTTMWTGANFDARMPGEEKDRWVAVLWEQLVKLSRQSPGQNITYNTPGFRSVQTQIQMLMFDAGFPGNPGYPGSIQVRAREIVGELWADRPAQGLSLREQLYALAESGLLSSDASKKLELLAWETR